MCLHTQLLNPTQHPLLSDLGTSNFIFLGSRSWQKCKCIIPDSENLHADSMYPWGSFHCAGLFCPATTALCLDKTFWCLKLTAWIRLLHTGRSTLSAPTRQRACAQWRWTQNTVTLPSPFRVSSLWCSGGLVQEDDSNSQRLLLVRPETSVVVLCKFQVVLDVCPRRHSGP